MKKSLVASVLLAAMLFAGCGEASAAGVSRSSSKGASVAVSDEKIENMHLDYTNVAPGILEERNASAVVDYSNTSDGYVMVQYLGETDSRIKAQVQMPLEKYSYDLRPGVWAALPLSEGDGTYSVSVFENIEGSRYAQVLSCRFDVKLSNEFLPFLRPNQFVDYASAPNTVATAALLTAEPEDTLGKVAAVYNYVVSTMTYDKVLAQTVQSGYVPVLDDVLQKKTGICFDYAALLTGMLRSCNIPSKLVIGYAGAIYHAWISVWVDGEGWVDNVIHFDGTDWQLMDPTFASTAGQKDAAAYAGTGSNYEAKFFY